MVALPILSPYRHLFISLAVLADFYGPLKNPACHPEFISGSLV